MQPLTSKARRKQASHDSSYAVRPLWMGLMAALHVLLHPLIVHQHCPGAARRPWGCAGGAREAGHAPMWDLESPTHELCILLRAMATVLLQTSHVTRLLMRPSRSYTSCSSAVNWLMTAGSKAACNEQQQAPSRTAV